MAKKKDDQPKSEGNQFNGPVRIGYVSDGQVAVDYPAEVRGTTHQVVINATAQFWLKRSQGGQAA